MTNNIGPPKASPIFSSIPANSLVTGLILSAVDRVLVASVCSIGRLYDIQIKKRTIDGQRIVMRCRVMQGGDDGISCCKLKRGKYVLYRQGKNCNATL